MGNYKFRLSDMMPNAWFYKLKDMGKPRNHSPQKQQQQMKKKNLSPPPTNRQQPHFINHRHSYYITSQLSNNKPDKHYNSPINPKSSDVHFPDSPRKSSKRRRRRRRKNSTKSTSTPTTKLVSSSVSAGCSCKATLDSVWTKTDSTSDYSPSPPDSSPEGSLFPEFGSEPDALASWSNSCSSCRVSSSTTDIILDMGSKNSSSSSQKFDKLDIFDSISELELPPIVTKPAKFNDMVSEIKRRDTEAGNLRSNSFKLEERRVTGYISAKEETLKAYRQQKLSPPIRRITQNSPGLKLRSNSPRIASKKIQAYSRKTISSTVTTKPTRKDLSDSFAIVKSSFDPQRDFRESMVEMIVENNIRGSKELEELLACYLSLNSNEYHDIIVKVFERIWFDLTDNQL